MAIEEGVFSCATIRSLPDDESYDAKCFHVINITYRDSVLEGARSSLVGVQFGETHSKNAESDPMTAPIVPRRARLKPEGFQAFGYTVSCPGCDQLQMGGSIRRNHTDACRDRIEAELDKTEVGKDRLGRAKDRLDAKVAEMVETSRGRWPEEPQGCQS